MRALQLTQGLLVRDVVLCCLVAFVLGTACSAEAPAASSEEAGLDAIEVVDVLDVVDDGTATQALSSAADRPAATSASLTRPS